VSTADGQAVPLVLELLLESAWDLMTQVRPFEADTPTGWGADVEAWRERYQAYLQDPAVDWAFPVPPEAPDPGLPAGEFGRIELPGRREHVGWVTEETRFGIQVAVVRGWDGQVKAVVAVGPGCQFVPLPAPLKRPEPRAAIGVGPHSAAAWLDEGPDEDEPVDDDLGPEVDDLGDTAGRQHQEGAPF
jgi:hypothetical protein